MPTVFLLDAMGTARQAPQSLHGLTLDLLPAEKYSFIAHPQTALRRGYKDATDFKELNEALPSLGFDLDEVTPIRRKLRDTQIVRVMDCTSTTRGLHMASGSHHGHSCSDAYEISRVCGAEIAGHADQVVVLLACVHPEAGEPPLRGARF